MENKTEINSSTQKTLRKEGKPSVLLSRFEFNKKWLGALLAVVLGLVAIVFWVVFKSQSNPEQGNVILRFDTPATIISGSAAEFKVMYENHDRRQLQNVVLELVYPEGFQFFSSSPESRDGLGRSFNLSELPGGASGSITITGIFSGSPQEIKTLKGRLFFQLKNLTSQFSVQAAAQVSLEAPDFHLRVTAPTELIVAQQIDYLITFQNISDQDLDRVQLRLFFPVGFSLQTASRPFESEGVLNWGRLAIGQEGQLRISGTLSGFPGEEKILRVDLGVLDDQSEFSLRNRTYNSTRISAAPLRASHKVSSPGLIASEGEEVAYEVEYENRGVRGMHNATVQLRFSGEAIDFSSVRAEGGALVGKTLIWNASGRPQLELVQPGGSGQFRLRFKIRQDLTAARIKNPSVLSQIFILSDELPEPISGGEQTVRVRTKLTPAVSISQVSGPAPAAAGEESVYKISVSAENSVNETSDVVWQAFLNAPPAGLVENSFTPVSYATQVTYNISSGRVSWQVGKFAAFEKLQLEFLVKLIPSVADAGLDVKLLSSVELAGKDEFTKESIVGRKEDHGLTVPVSR